MSTIAERVGSPLGRAADLAAALLIAASSGAAGDVGVGRTLGIGRTTAYFGLPRALPPAAHSPLGDVLAAAVLLLSLLWLSKITPKNTD